LINDPYLNGSFRINEGLRIARDVLVRINHSGVPAGCEFLDVISPQYIGDLVAWGAIGARTDRIARCIESLRPGCRRRSDSRTAPTATCRSQSTRCSRRARSTTSSRCHKSGQVAIVQTRGNDDCHIILRGGKQPNFDAASVDAACAELARAKLPERLMVDFSHANSSKQYKRQLDVAKNVAAQVAEGGRKIVGVMVESHLVEGRQELHPGKPLQFGQSITDACLGWDDSVALLDTLGAAVKARRRRGGAGSR
jgi:3-deoxy-7-phosphoheptulonate synthase